MHSYHFTLLHVLQLVLIMIDRIGSFERKKAVTKGPEGMGGREVAWPLADVWCRECLGALQAVTFHYLFSIRPHLPGLTTQFSSQFHSAAIHSMGGCLVLLLNSIRSSKPLRPSPVPQWAALTSAEGVPGPPTSLLCLGLCSLICKRGW